MNSQPASLTSVPSSEEPDSSGDDAHHAPWELTDFQPVTAGQLTAFLGKHRLDSLVVERWRPAGVINSIICLGEELILRVPKNVQRGWESIRAESIVVPVVHSAGVCTPELVLYDDALDVFDVPVTVYRRAPGADLGTLGQEPQADWQVYRELGADLARLHNNVVTCPDPTGILRLPERYDPEDSLALLARESLLNSYCVKWLERCLERLRSVVGNDNNFVRFLHNDATPTNIIADNGHYSALIDWGDAGWGDPALEFRQLPLRVVPAALDGYRSVMPLDGDATAEARVFFDHLAWALSRLTEGVGNQPLDWEAAPMSRLLELLAFAATNDLEDWIGLPLR